MKAIIGWLICKPGAREEFLAAMQPGVDATRQEEGCEFFEYHRDRDDPDRVILIEGFRDAEAHEYHRRTSHMAAMQAEVRRLLAQIKLIEIVSEDVGRHDLDFIANPPGPYKP